jgi:hypothetical protein
MSRRHPLLLVLLFGAVVGMLTTSRAVATGPVAAGRGAAPVDSVAEPCEATVVRRETLRDSAGNLLYIAPDAVVAHDGELLLAGHASVMFTKGEDGAFSTPVPSAFAVLVRDRHGRVRTYPAPPSMDPTALRDLRATRLSGGRWGVLFFQPRDETAPPDSVEDRLAFAILGPSGWERVERLQVPIGYRVQLPLPRSLQRRGDRIVIALVVRNRHDEGGVALFTRDGDRWSHRVLREDGVTYADLAINPRTGAQALLTVRSDRVPGTRSSNEVFVRTLPAAPSRRHLIPVVPKVPAHDPLLHAVGTRWSAAWLPLRMIGGRSRADVYHSLIETGDAPVSTRVAEDILWFVTFPIGDSDVMVVSSHQRSTDTSVVDLQLLPGSSRGIRLHHASPNARLMGATAWGSSEVVVTLANVTMSKTPSASTEVYWIKARCSAEPAEGRSLP